MLSHLASLPIASFFADNKIVVAACNIAALIVALYGLTKISLSAYKFLRNAWHTNIKSALRTIKRVNVLKLKLASLDLHYFVAMTIKDLAFLLMSLLLAIIMRAITPTRELRDPPEWVASSKFMMWWFSVDTMDALSGMSVIVMLVWALIFFRRLIVRCRYVASRRRRFLRKGAAARIPKNHAA